MNKYNGIEVDPSTEYPCSPACKSTGFTVLHYLVMNTRKHPEYSITINALISNYPDELHRVNAKGFNALMLAAANAKSHSSIDTVRMLLKHGTNINMQNFDGDTALMLACRFASRSSYDEVVQLLIDSDAKLDIRNNDGNTAIAMASELYNTSSNINTLYMLIDAGANVNIQNNTGMTPLHLASGLIKNGKIRVLYALLEAGANPLLKSNDGNNACNIAWNLLVGSHSDMYPYSLLEKYEKNFKPVDQGPGIIKSSFNALFGVFSNPCEETGEDGTIPKKSE